jgi:hypothetical protein
MLRLARLSTALLCAVLLTGCGRYYYSKPSATYSDFQADGVACARDVGIPSGNGQYAAVSPDLFRRCMAGKGWDREQKVEPEPTRWFRGVEGNEPIDLTAGPEQPSSTWRSPAYPNRYQACRDTWLDRSGRQDRVEQYRNCLRQ